MKKFHFLIRLALFWLLYFSAFRLAFTLVYRDLLPIGGLKETLWAFVIGVRMDLASTCYLLLIPLSLYLFLSIWQRAWITRILAGYQVLVICITTLLYLMNIYLYRHWGTLISARAFIYLSYFKEDILFISTGELILLAISWATITLLFYQLYKQMSGKYFIGKQAPTPEALKLAGIRWTTILFLPLLIVGMRGGLQFTPMNESITWYSAYPINNNIATNLLWHTGFSLLDESDTRNPYLTLPDKKAKEIVKAMIEANADSIPSILTTKHPNVVIIMLESWTADAVKALGGDTGTTPCFDTLRHHGLLFTQAYASGSRTDHGLASIISGFPAQPTRSIVNTPDKAKKLPFITDAFSKAGYSFSFYYGGDADFANMKIYLLNAHFTNIIDKASFPASESSNTKWGVQDEYVYARQLQDMNNQKQPFFSLIMTLSSHEPYEVPTHKVFSGKGDIAEKFRNSLYYSDMCLANYLKEASGTKWFDSTLFILCADHGNIYLRQRDAYTPEAHHITLMLYGGALKKEYRGKEISRTLEQSDIAAMLYDQLNFNHSQFEWSKDVLDPKAKAFACYVNDVAAGIVSGNQQNLVYYYNPAQIRHFSNGEISKDSLYDCSRAWLQLYYQQYLSY